MELPINRTKALLAMSRSKIEKYDDWAQNRSAANTQGLTCHPVSSSAIKWSADGAIEAEAKDAREARTARSVLHDATVSMGFTSIRHLNNRISVGKDREATHAKILEAFTTAMDSLENAERQWLPGQLLRTVTGQTHLLLERQTGTVLSVNIKTGRMRVASRSSYIKEIVGLTQTNTRWSRSSAAATLLERHGLVWRQDNELDEQWVD